MSKLFTKATKKQAKLRLGLDGPSGAGKTYTALAIGSALAEECGKPMAVIDTEKKSASLYSNIFPFDGMEFTDDYDPRKLIAAIKAAQSEGYGVLIIDSLSHFWSGKGGELDMVDKAAKRSNGGSGGNSFTAWKEVTPVHNELIDTILGADMHIIITLRVKTEYVIEDKNGKKVPRKVGTAPVMRDGLEYECTVFGDIDQDGNLIITKTRCPALRDGVYHHAGKDVANILIEWLNDGEAPPAYVLDATKRASLVKVGATPEQLAAVSSDEDAKALYVKLKAKQPEAEAA